MSKIIQYRNKCIGCGICYELHPDLWRMSQKDGKATLIGAKHKNEIYSLNIHKSLENKTGIVAKSCPVKIIHLL